MAGKPLRPCRHPGCRNLVVAGYCGAHTPVRTDRSAEAKAWHRLYDLPAWEPLRIDQLVAEPFCRACAKLGKRVFAMEVDHIVPHRGDMGLFLDETNLQSLCHSCHSRKTMSEMRSLRGE